MKTPLLCKVRALREEIEEKDRHIQQQDATISAMKERTRRGIQFMKEEILKTPLLCKVRALREEIEEKDRHIHKQNATISAMKERT